MKQYIAIIAALFLCLCIVPNAHGLTENPNVSGTVYDASHNPAAGAIVSIESSGIVLNVTSTDGSGQYSITLAISFTLPVTLNITATWGNQSGTEQKILNDGDALSTVDINMTAPPRYNITIHVIDSLTLDPVPSTLVIVSVDPFGTPVEFGSGYTNTNGDVSFIIESDLYRFTGIKSGYPTSEITRAVVSNTTYNLTMMNSYVPVYLISIQVVNRTSSQAISGAQVEIYPSPVRSSVVAEGLTDVNGGLNKELPSGTYVAVAYKTGYTPNETVFALNDNSTATIFMDYQIPSTPHATPIMWFPIMVIAGIIVSAIYLYSRRN